MVGGRRECIKLYGVTTPVTNSFIQCKSIHKEHHSCVRGAPGKGGSSTRGEKNENFKNVYFFSLRFHLPRYEQGGCALSSHWTLTFDVKELEECILSRLHV